MQLRAPRLTVRWSADPGDVAAAQALRHRAFPPGPAAPARPDGREGDAFDAHCRHLIVEEGPGGRLLATPRG